MEELYKKQFPLTGGNITITEPTVEDLYQSQHHHQGHDSTVITNCYNNFSLSPTKTVSIKRRVDHRLDEIGEMRYVIIICKFGIIQIIHL